jgi:protein SCO1
MRSEAMADIRLSWCLLVVAAAMIVVQPPAYGRKKEGRVRLDSPVRGGDFTLTDHNGRRFQLASHRGKVILLFFGYTFCTEACPVMLARVAGVYKILGADASQVLTLFVSVDPGRDKPAVLKEYLNHFSAGAVGLTGKKSEIDAVVKLYGARYEIEKTDSALGYHVNHSTYLYLIDQRGKLRTQFKHTDAPELIAASVRKTVTGDE